MMWDRTGGSSDTIEAPGAGSADFHHRPSWRNAVVL
jgi:hypothetical protein